MSVNVDIGDVQFENANTLRSYPFVDGCDMACNDDSEFPMDAIADAHFVVPALSVDADSESPGYSLDSGHAPINCIVRLSSLHVSSHMISACFTSRCGASLSALSVAVARDGFMPYYPYRLEELSGTEGAGGVVVFGDVQFPDFPKTYFPRDAKIHGGCVSLSLAKALRRIVDSRSGDSVSGNVGIDFSGHILAKKNGNMFSLALEEGSEAELASECAMISGDDACGATPIRSINGIMPDEDGNIVLWFH